MELAFQGNGNVNILTSSEGVRVCVFYHVNSIEFHTTDIENNLKHAPWSSLLPSLKQFTLALSPAADCAHFSSSFLLAWGREWTALSYKVRGTLTIGGLVTNTMFWA